MFDYGKPKSDSLLEAIDNDDADLIRSRLESQPSLLTQQIHALPPLHYAAAHGQVNAVNALLEFNPDPMEPAGISDRTALHYAALNAHPVIVEALLTVCDNCAPKDKDSKTPLQLAEVGLQKALSTQKLQQEAKQSSGADTEPTLPKEREQFTPEELEQHIVTKIDTYQQVIALFREQTYTKSIQPNVNN